MTSRPRRVGVYGGTFDPPHLAHLVVAERACQALALDELQIIPCGAQPLKGGAGASREQRLAMTRAAFAGRREFVVNDLELRREGVSFTVETLEALTSEAGQVEWWLVLGADALRDFPRWRQPERVAELARLAVVERPGQSLDQVIAGLPEWVRSRLSTVPMPRLDLASSELRADLAAGRSIRYLVPDAVLVLIEEQRLYRGD